MADSLLTLYKHGDDTGNPNGAVNPGQVIKVHPTAVEQHLKLGWRLADADAIQGVQRQIAAEQAAVAAGQAEIDRLQAAHDGWRDNEVAPRVAGHLANLAAMGVEP